MADVLALNNDVSGHPGGRTWVLRRADPSDFGRVSEFRGGTERRSTSPAYYYWKTFGNPTGRGVLNVADNGDRIIAIQCYTPKRFVVNGEVMVGAEISDAFTAPEFQRRGIFSSLVKMTREDAISRDLSFIYGTPNGISLPGYEKCNFFQADNADIELLVRPLDFRRVLGTKPGLKRFAWAVSPLASSFFRLRYPLHASKAGYAGISVTKGDGKFPASVEDLSSKAAADYGWMVFRSSEYLNWRFVENPDGYDTWLADDGRRLLGYLVCKSAVQKGLRVGYLADFLVDEALGTVFQALLRRAVESFIEDGVDMMAAWVVKGGHYSRVLKRHGFLRAWRVPLICYRNETGTRIADSVTRWHFTMADTDNI